MIHERRNDHEKKVVSGAENSFSKAGRASITLAAPDVRSEASDNVDDVKM